MREILLTQGWVALVSDEDYERVAPFNWHASLESRGTKWYAVRKITIYPDGKKIFKVQRAKIRMHRFILGLPIGLLDDSGLVVDHINHDSLDNRRENLRAITQVENMMASPGWRKKKREEPWL